MRFTNRKAAVPSIAAIIGLASVMAIASSGKSAAGQKSSSIRREAIAVEPLTSYLKQYNGVGGAIVMRADDMLYLSGLPPFDPKTGKVAEGASVGRQTEIVLEQMKLALESSGSSMKDVVKATVYLAKPEKFKEMNEVYGRYFPVEGSPARMTVVVPSFPAPFDIEIDCVAIRGGDR